MNSAHFSPIMIAGALVLPLENDRRGRSVRHAQPIDAPHFRARVEDVLAHLTGADGMEGGHRTEANP
jgi:hypothetical protein